MNRIILFVLLFCFCGCNALYYGSTDPPMLSSTTFAMKMGDPKSHNYDFNESVGILKSQIKYHPNYVQAYEALMCVYFANYMFEESIVAGLAARELYVSGDYKYKDIRDKDESLEDIRQIVVVATFMLKKQKQKVQ